MLINISSDLLSVGINPFGAELNSVKDKNGLEYLWQADPKYWKRHAPILFPFIGPLEDGEYTHNKKTYKMTSHGFARDNHFALDELGEDFASFILTGEETKDIYPFDFSLKVKYMVSGNKVNTSATVKNTGNEKMYFYLGGHPAFNCPLVPDESFDDYIVEFEKPEFIEQPLEDGSKRTILDNKTEVALSHKLFEHDVFMKSNGNSSCVSLKSKKSGKGVKIDFTGCDCIAVWSPASDAQFVCLEPWSSVPSINDKSKELCEKKLAICLAPHEEYDFSFTATMF